MNWTDEQLLIVCAGFAALFFIAGMITENLIGFYNRKRGGNE